MTEHDQVLMHKRIERIKNVFYEIGQVAVELKKSWDRKDQLLLHAMILASTIGSFIMFRGDVWLFKKLDIWRFYPPDGIWFKLYATWFLLAPIMIYPIGIRMQKRQFARALKQIFDLIGLKNALNSYPNFLSLEPMTGGTMKLRLTSASFTINEWQKKKEKLEASMQVYIDEIRDIPARGIIEITFSYDPMPSRVSIDNIWRYREYKFLIGRDRSTTYIGDFADSPHLLIAGETGQGKSAFIRQLITTIKLNQPEAEFHLLDLKGGVEFGYLEKVPGIHIIMDVSAAARSLEIVASRIEKRILALKERGLTDIKYFFQSDEFQRLSVVEKVKHELGRRIFVVVDECAEIFLFGLGHAPEHTRAIRACMSRITRLGRAVGIHVVLATQRPDKQAVDPQVKTNLTSTVCFRVHDHGSSLAILGSGRATDLPKVPGRAILHYGSDEMEIQTPYMEPSTSISLLEKAFKISLAPDVPSIDGAQAKLLESKNEKMELEPGNN